MFQSESEESQVSAKNHDEHLFFRSSNGDVESPLISPTESNSFLHDRIENLKYDHLYEIQKRNLEVGSYLGGGYFGAVYKGTLNVSQQWPSRSPFRKILNEVIGGQRKLTVAVKTAGEARSQEDVQLRKKIMIDELKLMCSVGSHPNVVTLIGAITQPDNPEGVQIIMEKCNSGSLFSYLFSQRATFIPQYEKRYHRTPFEDSYGYRMPDGKNRKTTVILPVTYKTIGEKGSLKSDSGNSITTAHLLSFAMQIAEGMDYLASNKCLHRDLAARNVLLTSDGLCKIADFGLAKRIGYEEYYRPQRVQDLPERWMAVECLQDRKFTIESDIWSYGILVYEIFTLAEIPYPKIQGEVSQHVIEGLRNDQPEFCPDPIYHHMTLCWDSDKRKRPSFRDSVNLMKKHLSQASKQVLEKVTAETHNEATRQRKLEQLRSQW